MEHTNLNEILEDYKTDFSDKVYNSHNEDYDLLMDVFGISPKLKRELPQYWGRQLGACLERIFKTRMSSHPSYADPIKEISGREPYDFQFKNFAIDTKYRLGSGDSGTINKWKQNASDLMGLGLTPVLLILRDDNLEAPFNGCLNAGWTIYTGDSFYNFSRDVLEFDIAQFLKENRGLYQIKRPG